MRWLTDIDPSFRINTTQTSGEDKTLNAGVPEQGSSTTEISAEYKSEIVNRMRGLVNEVLRESFGRDSATDARLFQGMLSTDQSEVDPSVTSDRLYSTCGTFSDELQANLKERGFMAVVSVSTHKDSNYHNYLVAKVAEVEVIIDPTIGQFIEGHNHTFVGTREQLYDLVMNQTGEGKPYITRSHADPQEAFERIWGEKSKPFRGQYEYVHAENDLDVLLDKGRPEAD